MISESEEVVHRLNKKKVIIYFRFQITNFI